MTAALTSNDLRRQLDSCPPGEGGWTEFERVGIRTLGHLFVPPLQPPLIQPRTLAGAERRDAVFPNRQRDPASNWGLLHADHGARMILTEFKITISQTSDPRKWRKPAATCGAHGDAWP